MSPDPFSAPVFVERLWRSVKYEEIYLKDYTNGWEAEASLGSYFRFYSHERIHQALGYRTPAEVYLGSKGEKHMRIARNKGERQTVLHE